MTDTPATHGQRLNVNTPVLRSHAADWDFQSQILLQQANAVHSLSLPRQSSGPFAAFFPTYEGIVDAIHDRCTEAGIQMTEISDTLRRVSNDYEFEESDHTHRLTGMTEQ